MSNFTIYTIGDIDFVYTAFNGIALIFSSHGSNEWLRFSAYAAAIGLFYKSMKWVLAPTKNDVPIFSWIMGLLFYSIAVIKADVTLESVKTGEVRNIDDVPLFIASTGELTTGLLHGLITDWRAAFDPLTPVGQVTDTLDDSLTLGPMTKMVKYMEWGGESSGFCQAFPNTMSGSEKPVTFDVCRIIQSIARDCIKTTQDSEVNTPLRGVALNEIYATDLASVMNVLDSMTANSLKTASVPMVTSTGLQYASCTDAWAAVKASFASPQGVSIMKHIGQMNQFIEPAKEETGQKSDFLQGVASSLFGSAGQAHDITTGAFVLNQIDKGVLQYRKSLGIAADYQLFEASMKRTNGMVSQGQLWLNISGAAISFLEMFSYMVAPFALIAILFLGGEGITSAAKYLQLIVFVNMWPITAVMVNAYVKMVLNQQFDTWSSLGVQTTMNWANMGSIQETYGSYLSVASALYCMVPMLTLFLLTTSIHPMMGALKNVTPDAPANTGHVTPEVWSAGNAGKQSFGDQTHTAATSTGGGMSSGGLLNAAVRSSMPSLSLGNNLQDTVSAAGRNDIGTTRMSSRTATQAFSEAWNSAFQGQHSQIASSGTQGIQQLIQNIASEISNGVGSNVGVSTDIAKSSAISAVLQAAGSIGASLGLGGAGKGISGQLTGLINGQINSNSSLTDGAKKAMTENLSNLIKDGSSFSNNISKLATNLTQDGFSSSDTYQKAAQKMDQYSQSISNTETNSFNKTGGQASQLAMSNSLNIDGNMISDTMRTPATEDSVRAWASASGLNADAIAGQWKSTRDMMNRSNTLGSDKNGNDAFAKVLLDQAQAKTQMESGETVAKNLADIKQTSAMFKNAVSMMGANEQILAPAAEKLDQFVALGSGGQYANYQEQAQMAPDTSAVPTAGEIGGYVAGQRAQATANLSQHRDASTAQPGNTIGGITAQSLNEDNGRLHVANEGGAGEGRVLSQADRDTLNQVKNNLPMGSTNDTIERGIQAGSVGDATTGRVQPLLLGDAPSNDFNASTQQTMRNLQSSEAPKSFDSFRSTGDKTQDAKAALTQATLHSENARNQIGQEREASLAESKAYLDKYNEITGATMSESGVERIGRQASDGKNNGFRGGLNDVVNAEVTGSGTTGKAARGSADAALGQELRENNGASSHPMDKASAAWQATGDSLPGHEIASDIVQRVAGAIPGGHAIAPKVGSQDNVPDAMGISSGRAPGSLIGNISNNIQLGQALNNAGNYSGMNDEKFTRMADQNEMLTRQVQHALSNDSRYGPDVADEYPKFIASLPKDIGVNEGIAKTKEFLDKHRKS
ncbi:conjugal transfer protein TraG N-terminal domain-containing protein (plasmid) [Klebsiella pneumoniae]|uniref:conjugal transfer protein TraG N-terminal domain-containing protein n=1 Tax=Klebsiella pneumoniae complex TaxID=3390273 RepID=UPI001EF7A345|nr:MULTISPECIES: conjugal transfer protein TraG N-terminal domain-containing protein [Klebsiella]ULK79291.1 conjugal transfer protein TraG N-terminal domain-containing protein [Klebsiella pneumoniae]